MREKSERAKSNHDRWSSRLTDRGSQEADIIGSECAVDDPAGHLLNPNRLLRTDERKREKKAEYNESQKIYLHSFS